MESFSYPLGTNASSGIKCRRTSAPCGISRLLVFSRGTPTKQLNDTLTLTIPKICRRGASHAMPPCRMMRCMIPKISRGTSPAGLVKYLFGKGRHNEHSLSFVK